MEILGYRILHEIGRGGMATVYLAVQESLDRKVALKVMSSGLAGNQEFKKRFMQEGRTVARLNHRNIVTIHDIGFVDDLYFIAMEYIVGRNLAERIQQGLTLNQCILIVKRVASALGHAHERGFVHRDIKPSNILFRDDKDAVLADFGIAKSLLEDEALTVAGLTPGTPNYMSPEQFRGRPLDGRSDLYSLGVLFYEMLTRERPFEAATGVATALRHINEPPPELPGELSSLRPVMSRLLAKEPDDRFSDAADLIEALEQTMPHRSGVSGRDPDETIFEPEDTTLETEASAFEPKAATAGVATATSEVTTLAPNPLLSSARLADETLKSQAYTINDASAARPRARGSKWVVPAIAATVAAAIIGGGAYVFWPQSQDVEPQLAAKMDELQKSQDVEPQPAAKTDELQKSQDVEPPAAKTDELQIDEKVLTASLARYDCDYMSAAVSKGGRVSVEGHVASQQDSERVKSAIAATPGVKNVESRLNVVGRPFCKVLSGLAPYIDRTPRPGLQLVGDHGGVYREGEYLVLKLGGVRRDSYIYADYYQLNGAVVHLLPNPLEVDNQLGAGANRLIGKPNPGHRHWQISPPFGREMIVMLVAGHSLFETPRPEIEPAAEYLTALKERLGDGSSGRPPLNADYVFIRTTPGEKLTQVGGGEVRDGARSQALEILGAHRALLSLRILPEDQAIARH